MKQLAILATLVLAATYLAQPAEGRDEKVLTTKDIMGKVGKPTGLYPSVAKELREADPIWAEVQQQTKEMSKLLAELGQATPPKGDKESWVKLTRAFADNAKALETAAAKMDLQAARNISKKMSDSCKGCHSVHRKQ
jgi:cytochrome c556